MRHRTRSLQRGFLGFRPRDPSRPLRLRLRFDEGALSDVEVLASGGNGASVALEGELDLACVPELEAQLRRVREHAGASPIRVELDSVSFIDASVLGLLCRLHELPSAAGLVLSCGDPHTLKLLRITGLDRRLPVVETSPRVAPGNGRAETGTRFGARPAPALESAAAPWRLAEACRR